jgi:hypothetical protein
MAAASVTEAPAAAFGGTAQPAGAIGANGAVSPVDFAVAGSQGSQSKGESETAKSFASRKVSLDGVLAACLLAILCNKVA